METYIQNRYDDIQAALATTIAPSIKYNYHIRTILFNLKNGRSIFICNADKYLGVVIMDRTAYEKEVLNHLSDSTSYQQIFLRPDKHKLTNKLRLILETYNVLTTSTDSNKLSYHEIT